jgi:arginase family enzyme
MSLAAFMAGAKALPKRHVSFAGKIGPVGWLGIDNARTGAPGAIQRPFEVALKTDTDNLGSVEWYKKGSPAIESPPPSVVRLPALDCGTIVPDESDTSGAVYNAVKAATATIVEKGYIPMCVGGTTDMTLPILEGIREVDGGEPFVLLHFAADSNLSRPDSAVRVIAEKKLAKGIVQFGTRGNGRKTRAARRDHEIKYVDANALFSKGIFTLRDIRNNYPLFVSVDLGVLDPAAAPGVLQPESGGLSVRELCHMLTALRGTRVMGVEINGFHPAYDVQRGSAVDGGLTQLAAAKVAKELLFCTYAMNSRTSEEGEKIVKDQQRAGAAPAYPDHL